MDIIIMFVIGIIVGLMANKGIAINIIARKNNIIKENDELIKLYETMYNELEESYKLLEEGLYKTIFENIGLRRKLKHGS